MSTRKQLELTENMGSNPTVDQHPIYGAVVMLLDNLDIVQSVGLGAKYRIVRDKLNK